MPRGRVVVGVGAIVVRGSDEDASVLLVKRANPPFKGMWSLPGGHLEPGEPVLEAAARELREETGIEAEPLGVAHIHELLASDGNYYVIIDVLMRYVSGEPRASSDALEARFYRLREALALELTPGSREIIESLPRLLGGCLLIPSRTVEEN